MNLPSPKPKQGMRLSSSKTDKVLPIIEIACSYGFVIFPILCKQRLPKDNLPENYDMPNLNN